MLGGGTSATRLTLALLAISAGAVGATGTDCCEADDGDACCPNPSILDRAIDYVHSSHRRVVFASERCCPDGSGVVGCSAYEAAGCCFCRDVCDEADESCVLCSVATSTVVADAVAVSPVPDGYITGEWYPPYDPESTDGLWGVFGAEDWNSDIEAMMLPGSYDFYEEPGEYDCSSCAWGDLSALKQRKLTERSRSMVCDSTCLTWDGDKEYGVTLCNYFNEGKECRACCHEGHMVEGCMPCEGQGSCHTCETKIRDLCREDPCSEECQAYVCCAASWSGYSGCVESMSAAVVELAESISTQCSVDFTCEMTDPTCSDNARTCTASVGDTRRLQEVAQTTCAVISVGGAGNFDADYASAGPLNSELVFKAIGARHAAYSLRSVSIDVCTGSDTLPYLNAANMDILVARSTTGRLAWNDGTELRPYPLNAGVGCARHVWVLQDTAGSHSHAFFAVDPSEHPRYITSDWVKVRLGGDMTRSDLVLSCAVQEEQVEWF